MSRKKSDWILVTGIFCVVGLFVIGLMRFATFYQANPQRSIVGALFGAALVWGLGVWIVRRPAGLRLPGKGGQIVCGLLCAAAFAVALNAEGLTGDIFVPIAILLAVVTLVYPAFSGFGGIRHLPKAPPRAPLPEEAKPKRKERRKASSKRNGQPRKRR